MSLVSNSSSFLNNSPASSCKNHRRSPETMSHLFQRNAPIFGSGSPNKDLWNERSPRNFEVNVFSERSDETDKTGGKYDITLMGKPLPEFKQQQSPELRFCEYYDGINKRKTKRMCESMMKVVDNRQNSDDALDRNRVSGARNDDYRSALCSEGFCWLQNLIEKTSSTQFNVIHGSGELRDDNVGNNNIGNTHEDEDMFENGDMYLHKAGWDDESMFAKSPLLRMTNSPDSISKYEDRGIYIASVDLKLNYKMDSEKLKVHIVRVIDVTNLRDNNKLIDSFLKLSIYQRDDEKKKRTKVAKRLRDPKFDETFEFDRVTETWLHITCLRVQLYQKKLFKTFCLGDALIWLDDYNLTEEEVTLTELFQPSLILD